MGTSYLVRGFKERQPCSEQNHSFANAKVPFKACVLGLYKYTATQVGKEENKEEIYTSHRSNYYKLPF